MKPRPIWVRWTDSYTVRSWRWRDIDQMADADHVVIVTVGWLLHENRRNIVVAAHYCAENSTAAGEMIIPKGAILKRRWLPRYG